MKIVHVVDYFQPQLGYQEFYLAREQQKMGHEVWVITSDRYFSFPDYEKNFKKVLGKRIVGVGDFIEQGIKVRRLPILFEYAKSGALILRDLRKALLEIKPEIVHAHDPLSPTAFLVSFYKSFIGFRLVFDNHAADFNTNFKDSFIKRVYYSIFFHFAAPLIKRNTDIFLPIGEPEQRLLCREFKISKEKTPIIRVGADTATFKPSKKIKDAIRKEIKINLTDILIVYTGKVTPNKDLHILIRALKPIFRKREDIKLLIVGGGDREYITTLKKLSGRFSPRLIWHKFVETSQLPGLYSASDIAVWPGDPSAGRLEAMSCGLPIIISSWFGTQNLIESGGVLTFSRGRVRQLTNLLKFLIENLRIRIKMGKKSRIFVKKYFTWEAVNQENLKFYQEILRKK